jgi:DinB superfamily
MTALRVNSLNTTAPSPIATPSFRPQTGESAPYTERYISLVQGNDILAALDQQRRQTLLLLCGRSEADGDFRYAPDKWSLKEVLGHIDDTERIMSYRALRVARGDTTPLPAFEQDDYVRNGPFAQHSMADWIEDYIAVRRATLTLFRNLDEAAWTRRGVASNHVVTVRALAYIIAGHELHHRKIIEEKYLK